MSIDQNQRVVSVEEAALKAVGLYGLSGPSRQDLRDLPSPLQTAAFVAACDKARADHLEACSKQGNVTFLDLLAQREREEKIRIEEERRTWKEEKKQKREAARAKEESKKRKKRVVCLVGMNPPPPTEPIAPETAFVFTDADWNDHTIPEWTV